MALHILTRLRRHRPRLPRGTVELRLLEALGQHGCPICRVTLGADERHLFWFLHENFTKSGFPESWTHSRGFCSAHGEHLLRQDGAIARIATSHRLLVHRRRRKPDAPHAPCPACGAGIAAAREAAAVLARLLEGPAAGPDGETGHLCPSHLRLVAPCLAPEALTRVLRAQKAALHLAPCHDLGPMVIASPHAAGLPPRLADPISTLARDLREQQACPVCLEMRRAWLEWATWLATRASEGRAPEDLLPVCAAHVRTMLDAAEPELAPALTKRAQDAMREDLRLALESLRTSVQARPLQRALGVLQARAPNVRAALVALERGATCPLCRRLEAACERTLALLFALLEQPAYRAAFENGYGLCIGHEVRGLALRPPAHIRACLERVGAARLALHEWELAEYARKSSWQARAEPEDGFMTAPARVLRRFAGFLCAPLAKS